MEKLGSPVVDPALVPELAAWLAVNPSDDTFEHFAQYAVHLEHFFAVGSLLCPRLVRYRGGIFLEGFSISQFDLWLAQTSSLTAVERVMNHRHMGDMLKSLNDAPRSLLLSAATLMQQCWRGRLHQLCPEDRTEVEVYQTDYDVEITFFKIRTDQAARELVQNS